MKNRKITGYLFIAPWIIGFLVFTAYPFISSLWLSFTNYNLLSAPKFVGIDNYIKLFNDPPAILIFTPIFLPIVQSFGMSAVQFGIIIVFNLCIGNITPPVGNTLFVGVKVGNLKIEDVMGQLIKYYVVIIIVLMLVTYIPAISMYLPTIGGFVK